MPVSNNVLLYSDISKQLDPEPHGADDNHYTENAWFENSCQDDIGGEAEPECGGEIRH